MTAPKGGNAAELLRSFNAAVAHHTAGRFAQARPLYERLVRQLPNHPDLLDFYGTLLHQLGDHAAAAGFVGRSVARRPSGAGAWNHLGAIRRALGDRSGAVTAFRRSALIAPAVVEPWINLGLLDGEAGDHGGAVRAGRRALVIRPGLTDVGVRTGAGLEALGRVDEALAVLETVRRAEPLRPDLALHRSSILAVRGDHARAVRAAQTGIVASPTVYELYPRLIGVRDPEADTGAFVPWARRATRIRPRDAALWANLAAELYRSADFAAAGREARRAALLDPADRSALQNLIAACYNQCRYIEGRRLAGWCLAAHPGVSDVLFALAEIELVIGDLRRAWALYEHRTARGDAMPRIGLPERWQGPGTETGPLLVAAEQGIGDEVVFLSCLPDLLAAVSVPVVVEVEPRLVSVFTRNFPQVRVVPRQVPPGAPGRRLLDYRDLVAREGIRHAVYAGSLPRFFRADRDRPATRAGYLRPDPERMRRWAASLERYRPTTTVGVVWRTARLNRFRAHFHAGILDWAPVFETPGCTFVSLMPGDTGEERALVRERLGVEVHRLEDLDAWNDIEGLMALMASLDVVVAARTASCAFAGAVGVPTIRVAPSFYRITDGCDLFFAGVTPILGRLAAFDAKVGGQAAGHLLRERIAMP